MSDQINHECGIALVRLLKPLEFYVAKYGTALYGIQKLHLMLQKQHNRGQDGAGIAEVKFDLPPGNKYISRLRSNANAPIQDLFNKVYNRIEDVVKDNKKRLHDVNWLKSNVEQISASMKDIRDTIHHVVSNMDDDGDFKRILEKRHTRRISLS